MDIAIIDYGSGNLHSAAKSFERAQVELNSSARIKVSSKPQDVLAADRIVLPGVGAYGDCKAGLWAIEGMMDALFEGVILKKKPFLGICVGMQLLSDRGLEHGSTQGFGWIGGEVGPIQLNDKHLKIPHMGWNTLDVLTPHSLLEDIKTGKNGLHAYFVHSFHFIPKKSEHKVLTTDYGGPITAMVAKENIVGVQFHPEKSQKLGLQFIKNFLRWSL